MIVTVVGGITCYPVDLAALPWVVWQVSLTFNKSLNMPIMQVSPALNFIVMAIAGAERVFGLLDEKPEMTEGYVTLVNQPRGKRTKIVGTSRRTGMWAWKHYHQADGTTSYMKIGRRCGL